MSRSNEFDPTLSISQRVRFTYRVTFPDRVWVSFDIDGLDPRFSPHTGTPVAGGLDFHEAVFVLRALARSGRTIVGFDLNEVAPGQDDEWDGNVGARMLWHLCGVLAKAGA